MSLTVLWIHSTQVPGQIGKKAREHLQWISVRTDDPLYSFFLCHSSDRRGNMVDTSGRQASGYCSVKPKQINCDCVLLSAKVKSGRGFFIVGAWTTEFLHLRKDYGGCRSFTSVVLLVSDCRSLTSVRLVSAVREMGFTLIDCPLKRLPVKPLSPGLFTVVKSFYRSFKTNMDKSSFALWNKIVSLGLSEYLGFIPIQKNINSGLNRIRYRERSISPWLSVTGFRCCI